MELGVHTFLDLDREQLETAGEVDVVFDVIGEISWPARRNWSGPAERWSPSPSRRRPCLAMGGQSSS